MACPGRKRGQRFTDLKGVKCPNCSFDCIPQAKQCPCGYSFELFGRPTLNQSGAPLVGYGAPPAGGGSTGHSANKQIVMGLIWLVAGIGITFRTYRSAVSSGGGQYVFAYGPIIFGAIQLLRGVGGSMRG